ncbi:MAG: YchJ family protein [Planctomycetota bacterium]
MTTCPCGSNKELDSCCGPILNGDQEALTAEALMRSRYTAFATGNIAHIRNSTYRLSLDKFDEKGARKWSEESKWNGLEIISVEEGAETDDKGKVEFKARYAQNEDEYEHHEIAEFKKEKGRWYFVDGRIVNTTTFIRETPKVGRNDPCTCGSGKKFKKCCGKAG